MAWWIRSVAIAGGSLLASWGAFSADLPAHSPPPAPELRPALQESGDWSGPYIGAYGGGGFASPKGSYAVTGDPSDVTPAISSQVDGVGSGSMNASGALGGVEGGWNLRFNDTYVVGVEADVGYLGLRGSRSESGVIPSYQAPFTVAQKLSSDWQAAVRARAGYLVTPETLLFVEAGPAFGRFNYSGSFTDYIPVASYNEHESASATAYKVGLTLGGGVEYMLGANVSLRADYLYTLFPSLDMTGVSNNLIPVKAPGYGAHKSGAMGINTVRLGVNFWIR